MKSLPSQAHQRPNTQTEEFFFKELTVNTRTDYETLSTNEAARCQEIHMKDPTKVRKKWTLEAGFKSS